MNAARPERQPATEQISGVIERVTFHNDDSGFCVLRIKTKGHPQVAGIGVPSGGDPASHAALHAAARNLIYTGITRGKKLVVLIGQKKALGIAVRNDRPQRR